MSDRIIDLSTAGAYLSSRLSRLVIKSNGDETAVPFEEIAAVAVSHPQVTITQSALAGLAEHLAPLVVCGSSHLPVGMLLPLDAHYIQVERFTKQARSPLPTRKRLWRQVVSAKVCAQGRLLECLYGDDAGLSALAGRVRSGDPSNIEAQASRRYWPRLFDGSKWRRDRNAEDQNRFLNYGYAILRAVVARAICAAGLHPSIGIHHKNRYNAFCLADDLMEPLRPVVDLAVWRLTKTIGSEAPLDTSAKQVLLDALSARVKCGRESRSIFDAAAKMASSLVAVFEKKGEKLLIPEARFVRPRL